MELTPHDKRLLHALEDGLPLVPRPFAGVAAAAGIGEGEAVEAIRRLLADGTIRRFGLVVRHRELGYRANAMVVWDIPDAEVESVGAGLAAWPGVTLCYRRRRHPEWPYNLYCMVHGKRREAVRAEIARMSVAHGIDTAPHAILFSQHCFKQRGASYRGTTPREAER